MPTRNIDPAVIRRAFDVLVPPASSPKQYLRWKELAKMIGLGEHWIRKRYQGRERSELEVHSIERIRKALEGRQNAAPTPDPLFKSLIEALSTADARNPLDMRRPRARFLEDHWLHLGVVNVGFVLSSNANYCRRLEAGIRLGMINGLRMTHLLDDETTTLEAGASESAKVAAVRELLNRFNEDPGYVERTYLVPFGTVAAKAVSRTLKSDRTIRNRLGKDLRVIFAGVTDPRITGLLDFNRDHIGGMYAGTTFVDRLRFVAEAFPDRPIAFLYDPRLPQDIVVRDQVLQYKDASVEIVAADRRNPTRLPKSVRHHLVTGYTVVNQRIHELVRDNPETPFIGPNTTDLGRGAVMSAGNDDLQFGIDCAQRLLVPDCRNEINLRDQEILRPTPVYGINQKACNRHGLVPKISARNKCTVVID